MLSSTKRYRSIGNLAYLIGVALVIASLVTGLIPPRVASAHHPVLSGIVACQQDGTQLITWTVGNSESSYPMEITAISVSSGTIDIAVGTVVPVSPGSVSGQTSLPGSQTGQVTISVTGFWDKPGTDNDVSATRTEKVILGGGCESEEPDYQLNLSHIYCYDGDNPDLQGLVEIHFVLLNVPDGITPGTLTYTYGSIVPGAHTGNVWHYTDYLPSGDFDIQSASVEVDGVTVNLHNPGDYAGTYDCGEPEQASASVTLGVCRWDQQSGSAMAVDITLVGASLTIDGVIYTTSTSINLPPGDYPYTWSAEDGYTGSGSGELNVGDCVPLPVPGALVSCYDLENSAYKVLVSNSSESGEIGYATDLDASIVSLGMLANGEEVELLVPGDAIKLFLYPEDGEGGWGEPVEINLDKSQLRLCLEDPISLTQVCSYVDLAKPYGWTVTNLNAFSIEITWTYGPESSLSPIALTAGEAYAFATAAHDGEVMQVFVDGFLLESGEHETCPAFLPLDLSSYCTGPSPTTFGWSVFNPNPFAVEAEWRVTGSLLADLLSIPAGASLQFTTPISEGDIVQVYYGGVSQDSAAGVQDCQTPENPPDDPPFTPPQTPPLVEIPVTSTVVLIPVTGVADDLGSMAPAGMLSLGLGFFGLGTVLHGVAQRKARVKVKS
jgi:hypothetical protein